MDPVSVQHVKRIWEDGEAEKILEGSAPVRQRALEHVMDLKISAAMATRTAADAAAEANLDPFEQRAVSILVAQKILHMTKARR